MATNKQRITISLDKHQHEVLARLAKANRQPMSRIVSELVDATTPYLERAVVIVEQAAKLKGAGISGELRQSLDKAEAQAVAQASSALGQVDLLLEHEAARQRGAAVGAAADDAQRRPAASPTPVPSNHGGQVVKTAPKRGRSGIVKRGGRPPVALGQAIAKAVKKGARR